MALAKLAVEDPSFRVKTDAETGQTIISGMGELHLEIIVDRLVREFKVEANVGRPQVAYRETIARDGRRGRASTSARPAAAAQYGHVSLHVEPARGQGDRLRGRHRRRRRSRREFMPAVEQGVREALARGVLAGYPMIDVDGDADRRQLPRGRLAARWPSRSPARWRSRRRRARPGPVLLEPVMRSRC